jgi:hypothetical protein
MNQESHRTPPGESQPEQSRNLRNGQEDGLLEPQDNPNSSGKPRNDLPPSAGGSNIDETGLANINKDNLDELDELDDSKRGIN